MKNIAMQNAREIIPLRRRITKALKISLGVCVVVLSFSSFAIMVFYLVYSSHDSKRHALWMREYRNNKNTIDAGAIVRHENKELEKMRSEKEAASGPFEFEPVVVFEPEYKIPAASYDDSKANYAQNIDYGAEVSAYQARLDAQKKMEKQKSSNPQIAPKRQTQRAARSPAPAQRSRPELKKLNN